MQFSSGEPPINVKKNDLKPEISELEAHQAISNLVGEWINQLL